MARLVSFALLAALISAPASAGPCAIPMVAAAPIIPANSVIAPGGGVLVALGFGGYGGGNTRSTGLEQKGWRYLVKGKLLVPAIKVLAPGLAVYEIPDEVDAQATIALVDDNRKELVAVKRAPQKQAELPAPSVKSIVHDIIEQRGPRSGGQSRTVVVNLTTQPPAGAVGLILYPVGKTPLPAVSWLSLAGVPGGTQHVVYASGGRCSIMIPGQTEVPSGARATVAWVDASGRVSAKSQEVVVAKGATPPKNSIGP